MGEASQTARQTSQGSLINRITFSSSTERLKCWLNYFFFPVWLMPSWLLQRYCWYKQDYRVLTEFDLTFFHAFKNHLSPRATFSYLMCALRGNWGTIRVQYSLTRVFQDIPHMEDIMFNMKFTYLKILDVTQDLWLSITQILHLEKYSNCNSSTTTWLWSHYQSLKHAHYHDAASVDGKEYVAWSQFKILQDSLASCWVTHSMLGWTTNSLCPCCST